MTALLHIHSCSSVLVTARSSSRYPVVVWLWDLLSWSFEFRVWTHSYGPSPQSRVLGRATICMEWNLENGWNFAQLQPLRCAGGVTRRVVVVQHPNSFARLLTFSAKMASVKCFSSLLQKHNSLFVLEGQNNAAPHWSGCRRDQLDLIFRSCDLWFLILGWYFGVPFRKQFFSIS